MADLEKFKSDSKNRASGNRRLLQQLRKADERDVDQWFHDAHEEVFSRTDCLTCANCCKTTSPIFQPNDIERVAKALRMRPGDFTEKFLKIDEDNDFVLKSTPCPFLLPDNRCSVYDHRPRACREYPHTDRRKMVQIFDLTYRNTLVCPAVLEIIEKVREASGIK